MDGSEPDKAIEQIILGIEQDIFTAIRQKNVHSLGRFLADDFVHRAPDGSESTKEVFLQNISAMPVEVSSIKGEHQRVDCYGEVAVLTGVQRAEWRQGEVAEGVSSVAFTDVFCWRGDRWLLVLAFSVDLPGLSDS
jgi:hypothetical protein